MRRLRCVGRRRRCCVLRRLRRSWCVVGSLEVVVARVGLEVVAVAAGVVVVGWRVLGLAGLVGIRCRPCRRRRRCRLRDGFVGIVGI